MNSTEVLHSAQELFTIVATGEIGVSLRGLSRLSGLGHSTISKWFGSDLSHPGTPEPLKHLASKSLYLDASIKVRGSFIKPLRSDVAMSVIEYAAFSLGKKEAQDNYSGLCRALNIPVNEGLVGSAKFRALPTKRVAPCFLYMIQDTASKACKIGVSNDPVKRLAALQTSFPYPLALLWAVPGGFSRERRLHSLLKDFHLRGEWFDPIVFSLVNPALV